MTDWGEEESEALLAKHSLGRAGVQVKLDKGFEPGDYCVNLEYRGLADGVGFTAARRQALDYASRLHGQLAGVDEWRRVGRRESFRQRLETLLEGEAYRQMDGAMKERLLAEVTAMVVSSRGREL